MRAAGRAARAHERRRTRRSTTSHSVRASSGARPRADAHAPAAPPGAPDGRRLDAPLGWRARDLGEIGLSHVGARSAARSSSQACRARRQQHAARLVVEAVDEPSLARVGEAAAHSGKRATMALAAVPRSPARSGCEGTPAGLSIATSASSTYNHATAMVSSASMSVAASTRIASSSSSVWPATRRWPLAREASVDTHAARGDEPPRARDAQPGPRLGDDVIDPIPGPRRVDAHALHERYFFLGAAGGVFGATALRPRPWGAGVANGLPARARGLPAGFSAGLPATLVAVPFAGALSPDALPVSARPGDAATNGRLGPVAARA